MGCISSKLAAADLRQERKLLCGAGAAGGVGIVVVSGAGDYSNHIVSLTSSTYGVLKLDRDDASEEERGSSEEWRCRTPPPLLVPGFPKRAASLQGETEVINAWELMEDLDDDIPMYSPAKKATAPKPGARRKSFEGVIESPRKQKKGIAGKENLHGAAAAAATERTDVDPGRVLKPLADFSKNQQRKTPISAVRFKSAPINWKIQASSRDPLFSEPRKSIHTGPLFDPDLLASFEREHCEEEEEEQIKKMVSSSEPWKRNAGREAAPLRPGSLGLIAADQDHPPRQLLLAEARLQHRPVLRRVQRLPRRRGNATAHLADLDVHRRQEPVEPERCLHGLLASGHRRLHGQQSYTLVAHPVSSPPAITFFTARTCRTRTWSSGGRLWTRGSSSSYAEFFGSAAAAVAHDARGWNCRR